MSFSLAFKSISHTFGLDPVSIVLLLLMSLTGAICMSEIFGNRLVGVIYCPVLCVGSYLVLKLALMTGLCVPIEMSWDKSGTLTFETRFLAEALPQAVLAITAGMFASASLIIAAIRYFDLYD